MRWCGLDVGLFGSEWGAVVGWCGHGNKPVTLIQ